ncbi:MAG: NADP-dependent malic enzyme, partial [Erysipelothrix sp.]|nr:NADP-dependent malic enzyme [Erysipelothrix sp.]
RLIEELDIPVFHDDQHGTAIVVAAGLINALKLVNKKPEDVTVVVSGTGAAGNSIIRILNQLKVKEIYGFNINGIIIAEDSDKYGFLDKELVQLTNFSNKRLSIEEAMKEADVFIGVSVAGILSKDMVRSMKENPIVFAMANPEPEISYADAKEAGAAVVGTGRSDSPNQVNNILAFPGIFRGALDCRATKITEEMKMAAAVGLASLVTEEELTAEYVIPDVFDERVAQVVASEVMRVARATGIAKA